MRPEFRTADPWRTHGVCDAGNGRDSSRSRLAAGRCGVPIAAFDAVIFFDGSAREISSVQRRTDRSAVRRSRHRAERTRGGRGLAETNGAAATRRIRSLTRCRLTVETYSCPAGRGLENVIVDGGGHNWPGAHQGYVITLILGRVTDNIDANAAISSFFEVSNRPRSLMMSISQSAAAPIWLAPDAAVVRDLRCLCIALCSSSGCSSIRNCSCYMAVAAADADVLRSARRRWSERGHALPVAAMRIFFHHRDLRVEVGV